MRCGRKGHERASRTDKSAEGSSSKRKGEKRTQGKRSERDERKRGKRDERKGNKRTERKRRAGSKRDRKTSHGRTGTSSGEPTVAMPALSAAV